MAIVKIEDKEITLPDDVVKAGVEAVRAVLAANGFPAVENADIQLPDASRPGAPAVVTPRSTGKGAGQIYDDVIEALIEAPAYLNPAIALAAETLRAESEGDLEFFDRAYRSGAVERAISEGQREGRDTLHTLKHFGHIVPNTSLTVPTGF